MNANRRAFLAGLAAVAAPLFARLALPAPPERKLLGDREGAGEVGHLYIRVASRDGKSEWQYVGRCVSVTATIESPTLQLDAPFPDRMPSAARTIECLVT